MPLVLSIDTWKGIVILEWHCVCLWHLSWELYSVRNIFRSEQIFYHWGCQSLVRAEGAMWQISPAAGVGWRRGTMLWWTDYFARRGNLALSSAGLGWARLWLCDCCEMKMMVAVLRKRPGIDDTWHPSSLVTWYFVLHQPALEHVIITRVLQLWHQYSHYSDRCIEAFRHYLST